MEYAAWVASFCFIGMFALILLGVPIFISMLAAACVGSWLVAGSAYTLEQFSVAPYYITASYSFAVVPLFLLMGVLASNCGIAESAYNVGYKWLGNVRGGLLSATVAAATIFGACCGHELASVTLFSKISMPELAKHNYDKPISLACITISGALSGLIPPSVGIIIFCIIVEQSIGRTLVAGIVPGIILAMFLMICITLVATFRPNTMPKVAIQVSWKERFSSIGILWPVVFLVILVIGGMYLGVFPPTIGGAIGSAGVLLVGLWRRIGMRTMVRSFWETILINATIFPLIIGGYLFARFISVSGLPGTLVDIITASNLPPLVLILVVVVFYLIIGCVLEIFSMAIVTLPLVFPLLVGVGFDPTAILIMLVLLLNIANITPPIGIGVFVASSIAGIQPEKVFREIVPFFLVCLVLVCLLVFFPEIATWLPNLLYGALAS